MSSASQQPQDSSKTAIQDISTVFLVERTERHILEQRRRTTHRILVRE